MDDYTFVTLAKSKADRLRLQRQSGALQPWPPEQQPPRAKAGAVLSLAGEQPRAGAGSEVERAVMRTVAALAGSLILNFAALGALEWAVQQAQIAPAGQVFVRQLPDKTEMPAYARVAQSDDSSDGSRTVVF